MADFLVTEVSLLGVGASQVGRGIKVANCDKVSMSFAISNSSTITTGSKLVLTGTNDDARALDFSTTLPTLTTGSVITALPAGIALTANELVFTSVAAGTYEISMSFSSFPKWIRPVWTLVGGGGTMTTQVTIAGWSTST